MGNPSEAASQAHGCRTVSGLAFAFSQCWLCFPVLEVEAHPEWVGMMNEVLLFSNQVVRALLDASWTEKYTAEPCMLLPELNTMRMTCMHGSLQEEKLSTGYALMAKSSYLDSLNHEWSAFWRKTLCWTTIGWPIHYSHLLQDRVIPPSVGLLGKISWPACSETLDTVHRVQLYRGRKTDVVIKAAFQPAVFLSNNGFSAILHFPTSMPAPPHRPATLCTSVILAGSYTTSLLQWPGVSRLSSLN